MSSSTLNGRDQSIHNYIVDNLETILPLDKPTLDEMASYAMNLPSAYEVADHFKQLLGESPQALNFINDLNTRLWPPSSKPISNKTSGNLKKNACFEQDAFQAIQHLQSGGKGSNPVPQSSSLAQNQNKSKNNAGKSKKGSGTLTSDLIGRPKPRSPVPERRTASPSSASPKMAVAKDKHLEEMDYTTSLKEIDDAIKQLEISGVNIRHTASSRNKLPDSQAKTDHHDKSEKSSREQQELTSEQDRELRRCDCMGTKHPLLAVAPNCLNCGHIVCTREGLGPCTYCGADLLTRDQKSDILNQLRQDRGRIKMALDARRNPKHAGSRTTNNNKLGAAPGAEENVRKYHLGLYGKMIAVEGSNSKHRGKSKTSINADGTNSQSQVSTPLTTTTAEDESLEEDLKQANQRLEKLLHLQATGSERTKLIDVASDYEMPFIGSDGQVAGNYDKWASPAQRALQLKAQQRQLRRQQRQEARRSGRGRQVLSIDLKGNRVMMEDAPSSSEDDDTEAGSDKRHGSKERSIHHSVSDPDAGKEDFVIPVYPSKNEVSQSSNDEASSSQTKPSERIDRVQDEDDLDRLIEM